MKTISSAEARRRFAEITDEVRQNKEVYSVVRHGKEIVRIMPPVSQDSNKVNPNLDNDIQEFFDKYNNVLVELAKR